MERPNYIPNWWIIREGRFSAGRWMLEAPRNALIYWIVSGVVGVAIVVWRLVAGDSLDDVFGSALGVGLTVIAGLLVLMAVLYGSRALRATRKAAT